MMVDCREQRYIGVGFLCLLGERNMARLYGCLVGVVSLLVSGSVLAARESLAQSPSPIVGVCPGGFYPSGKRCVPIKDRSNPAMQRGGQCPSGYYTSGNYCVAMSKKSKVAIPKDGLCPSGYYPSGGYCLENGARTR